MAEVPGIPAFDDDAVLECAPGHSSKFDLAIRQGPSQLKVHAMLHFPSAANAPGTRRAGRNACMPPEAPLQHVSKSKRKIRTPVCVASRWLVRSRHRQPQA